jgi:hypothetical protein
MQIKKVKIICSECGSTHEIRKGDYDRKIRNGQDRFYCSLKCSGKADYKNNPKKLEKNKGNISLLKGYEANRLDKYSPFKYSLNKAKSRSKQRGEETDLTLEYLKEIYDKQKGLCAYTNIKMEIPRSSQDEDIKKSPKKLSLDRIHSHTGYIKGNVEFVCYCINVMKNDFTKKETLNFINEIKITSCQSQMDTSNFFDDL